MGLVVLTVVVRLVTEGSVSILAVGGIIGVALLFLLLGGVIGLRIAPTLFGAIDKVSRSAGTLVALAFAFTLVFAELANSAKLAPIVGAFVAGIALSKTRQSDRIRRELAPVGHLFIPVFFLQIGIDADVGAFGKPEVLRDAAILLAVAVVGKLLSTLGAIGAPGDKALIGLGMLPRGEVGLIFATIGLQAGVLGNDLYAALLLVVLATTLAAPQLLKLRYAQMGGDDRPTTTPADTLPPDGGWLSVGVDDVDLAARPPDDAMLPTALDAAILLARRRPTAALLDWLAEAEAPPPEWDRPMTGRLLDVVERGNARSWRFLETAGVLDRTLPELAEAFRRRGDQAFSLDPLQSHRFVAMERLRQLDADDPLSREIQEIEHVDRLLLATFLVEALEDEPNPEEATRAIVGRLAIEEVDAAVVRSLVADRDLLWSAAHQPGAMSEEPVRQLATHLDTPDQARSLYVVSALRSEGRERWELQRLRTLHELIQAALEHDELAGHEARHLVEVRKLEAAALLLGEPGAQDRLSHAPRAYVIRTPSVALARHARLLHPPPARDARVAVTAVPEGGWWVDVAWQDHPGLLAAITRVLASFGLSVHDATLATWPDDSVLDAFRVTGTEEPAAEGLRTAIATSLDGALVSEPVPDAEVDVDSTASPWHSVCEIRATDRPGLLHAIATTFAAAGVNVRSAQMSSRDDLVIDRFEVTDADGAKLSKTTAARLRELLHHGVTAKRRRFGRRLAVKAGAGVPRS